jgi:hypothetical protein
MFFLGTRRILSSSPCTRLRWNCDRPMGSGRAACCAGTIDLRASLADAPPIRRCAAGECAKRYGPAPRWSEVIPTGVPVAADLLRPGGEADQCTVVQLAPTERPSDSPDTFHTTRRELGAFPSSTLFFAGSDRPEGVSSVKQARRPSRILGRNSETTINPHSARRDDRRN